MVNAQPLMDLTAILHAAQQHYASDVHIDAAHNQVFIRSAGRLKSLEGINIAPSALSEWLLSRLTPIQRTSYEARQQFDFAHSEPSLSLYTRVTVYFNQSGLSIAIRLLPSNIATLEALGAPSFLSKLSPFQHGLVLITGSTGSGKSTTLSSYLAHINQHYAAHVVTLEDPIEYQHRHQKCLFHQYQKHVHFDDYATALNNSLRLDPDVIVVGELRDLNSIEMALRAAETGHLVLATLHSTNAVTAITRIIDVFNDTDKSFIRHVLGSVLLGVIAQRLVKSTTKEGRVAVFETLIANTAVKNMIFEQKESQLNNLIQTHAQAGMFTFAQHYQKLLDTEHVNEPMPQWAS